MRVCSGPGCLRKIDDGVRFCSECQPKTPTANAPGRTHTTAYDAALDALRKGTRWQQTRARVVRQQPICARCDRAVSEIVDHLVPAHEVIAQARASGFWPLDKWAGYFFMTNLQGLCRKCHWFKTNEDKQHTGDWPDAVAKERVKPRRVWTF